MHMTGQSCLFATTNSRIDPLNEKQRYLPKHNSCHGNS